jgi:hypothetical protein
MPSSNAERHRWLLRQLLRLWPVMAVIVTIVMALVTATYAIADHAASNQATGASARVHLWRALASQEEPTGYLITDHLIRDLQPLLGPIDPSAQGLPQAVKDFAGSTNLYGGITRELGGYEPFVGTGLGGEENGHFTSDMLGKLLLIKQGKVDQLVEQEEQIINGPDWSNLIWWFIGTWLVASLILLAIAHRRAYTRHDETLEWTYPNSFRALEWYRDGDGDTDETFTIMCVPLLGLWVMWQIGTRKRTDAKIAARYPNEYSALKDAEAGLQVLRRQAPDDAEVRELGLWCQELRTQLHDRLHGETVRQEDAELRRQASDVRSKLDYLNDQLKKTGR